MNAVLDGGADSDWLLRRLACPVHKTGLDKVNERELACEHGCRYPVVHGVPVLLSAADDYTHEFHAKTLAAIQDGSAWRDFGTDEPESADGIDAWVNEWVGATNSNLYKHLIGGLPRYPIPDFAFPPSVESSAGLSEGVMLDIGCGWGRWCLAEARLGRRAVGIDPSLSAVLAATRVARQLGLDSHARFVVADARSLPFLDDSLERAFSFSVLQHFAKPNTIAVLKELKRAMKCGAQTRLHLLNGFGLRSLQVQLMRGFREAREFEVRYWTPGEMRRVFERELGPSELQIGSFFVQAAAADVDLLLPGGQRLMAASGRLVRMAQWLPVLRLAADNLFVNSSVSNSAPS